MQTFLPYESFEQSARALDRLRLGKQRIEAMTILSINTGKSKGWKTHPAVIMWQGYDEALLCYIQDVCRTWVDRGYRDTVLDKMTAYWDTLGLRDWRAVFADHAADPLRGVARPWFIGDERFHASHRALLLHKAANTANPLLRPYMTAWYAGMGWTDDPADDCWWPTEHAPGSAALNSPEAAAPTILLPTTA